MRVVQAAQIQALQGLEPAHLPTEFRLFALGENETSKGTFVLDSKGLAAIMAAFADHGVDLAIDYEHQTFAAAENGKPAPAAGWFTPEARADGLWATNVRWTDVAAEMLRRKEYRYFSPTFNVDEDNRITRLLPLALTNFPATKNLEPLIAARDSAQTENRMSNAVNKVLGLKDDAEEGQTTHRVMALVANEKELLSITGKSTPGEALGALIAMKDAAVELEKARASLRDWEERAARDEADEKRKQIDAIVEGAIVDGRVSLKDVEKIAQLKRHGERYGIEALNTAVSMISPRPRPLYMAPPPASTVKEQLKAVEEYKKANPGATTSDAYIALAGSAPALFSNIGEEA